jgi:tRNA (cytidine/uridine-2'-O-)-methyltransferase
VDYWEAVDWVRYRDWDEFLQRMAGKRLWLFTARGGQPHHQVAYEDEDCLVFGSESRGLPESLLAAYPTARVCIALPSGKVRSLNLATAVGIAVYRALERLGRI